jgi:hypothetical protein
LFKIYSMMYTGQDNFVSGWVQIGTPETFFE